MRRGRPASEGERRAARRRPGALVRAAAAGDTAEVRRLLAAGADVDGRTADGRTAVTAAALGDHVATARVLIDAGADVDLQDADRNNPLLVCGETGSVAMLREVLRATPDLTATNRFGGTALIPASDRGHVDMVRALLRTEIDVDHVNNLGWTALLEAVILGEGGPPHQQIVRALVDAGADVDLADRDGVTAARARAAARVRGDRPHARGRGRALSDRRADRAGGRYGRAMSGRPGRSRLTPAALMDRLRARDPGLAALRRAARAAIVMPACFALSDVVIGNGTMALFAAFGALSTLLFVDFGGTMQARVTAQTLLVATAAVLVTLGTLASQTAWLAVAGTVVVAFAVSFAGIVSSTLASATTPMLVAFVLAVAVPGDASSVPDRLAGFLLSGAASVLAIRLLWPAPVREPLRAAIAESCRCLAARLRAEVALARDRADPDRRAAVGDAGAAARDAVAALRRAFFATPTGPRASRPPRACSCAPSIGLLDGHDPRADAAGSRPGRHGPGGVRDQARERGAARGRGAAGRRRRGRAARRSPPPAPGSTRRATRSAATPPRSPAPAPAGLRPGSRARSTPASAPRSSASRPR